MSIKPKKKSTDLPPQDDYAAILHEVVYKPNDDDAKKAFMYYKTDIGGFIVPSERKATLSENSDLRRDVDALAQKKLTQDDLDGNYELRNLIGRPCIITVRHKSGSGGRAVATVVLVRPVPKSDVQPSPAAASSVQGPTPPIALDVAKLPDAEAQSLAGSNPATV